MSGIYTVEKPVKAPPESHFRLNITQLVQEAIGESGFAEGHVIIQTKHTTTGLGLLVQEDERGLMDDFLRLLERIVPEGDYYRHDDFSKRTENLGPEERKNAVSHLRALFFPTSLTLVFRNRQLQLGPWQSVLLFDFDPEGRPFRTLIIQVCGEK